MGASQNNLYGQQQQGARENTGMHFSLPKDTITMQNSSKNISLLVASKSNDKLPGPAKN